MYSACGALRTGASNTKFRAANAGPTINLPSRQPRKCSSWESRDNRAMSGTDGDHAPDVLLVGLGVEGPHLLSTLLILQIG